MPIINKYENTRMIISPPSDDLIREFIGKRRISLIGIDREFVDRSAKENRLYEWFIERSDVRMLLANTARIHVNYLIKIDDEADPVAGTYLHIEEYDSGKDKYHTHFKPANGISVTYPSVDELLPLIRGKRLIFSCEYAENECDVESRINRNLQEAIFDFRKENVRKVNKYYLYDKYFDVKVFLRRITKERTNGSNFMTPADIRDFDINSKLLETLTEPGRCFDGDDAKNVKYASVSDKLQAQYFLSKFRINWGWDDKNPICIFNYRLSAFLLPDNVLESDALTIPDDRIATDEKSGIRYVIDSIHVNSDICFGTSEFSDLIDGLIVDIGLA